MVTDRYLNNHVNKAAPKPRSLHKTTPLNRYDFNFCYKVQDLKSDRVELRPFLPSTHAELAWEMYQRDPGMLNDVPFFWESLDDVYLFFETWIRSSPASLSFALYTAPLGPDEEMSQVATADYVFAGVTGIMNVVYEDGKGEIGPVLIDKAFRRTHVQTHQAGLLLHYMLDMPFEGGLGLRRVQWTAHIANHQSQASSKRLGFKEEGILRGTQAVAVGKAPVNGWREGDYLEGKPSWDVAFFGLIFRDWENGAREHVDALMARKA